MVFESEVIMGRFIDISGQRFGRLTVISHSGTDSHRTALWRCICDCGTEVIVPGTSLRSGNTKSCGCFNRDQVKERFTKHGMTESRLYQIWAGMKARCLNPNAVNYADYGGRGISICSEWLESFDSFQDWALQSGYRDDLTLDRKDNDGAYCPSNCQWVTMKAQSNNRRNARIITYNGESHTLAEWSEITGINYNTLYARLGRGWPLDAVFASPRS